MAGYTKLFHSILASTVWNESMETRIVWITLMAMADRNGIAEGSVPGLAVFARIPVEATRQALTRLSEPDAESRSHEAEGRRIVPVEGGWQLVNHQKYRAKMGADERRDYLKLKQREYRALKKRKKGNVSTRPSTHVNNVSDTDTESTHPSPTPEQYVSVPSGPHSADAEAADYDRFVATYPVSRRVGGKAARKAFGVALAALKPDAKWQRPVDRLIAAVEQQRRSRQWQDPALIPLMTTWLNQQRWHQVLPEEPTSQTRGPWACPHVVPCGNPGACANATTLGRPLRKVTA